MTPDAAEVVALKVLGWLVSNEEILPVFLGSSGLLPTELRARAGEPEVLCAVLEFVMMDDAWVCDCAQGLGLEPQVLMQARQALPGGGEVHWT